MKEEKASPSPEFASKAPAPSPGVATLLRGGNGTSAPGALRAPQPVQSLLRKRLVRGSLLLADTLLLGVAAHLALKPGGFSGPLEMGLCVVAVVLGAWLSCLALGAPSFP